MTQCASCSTHYDPSRRSIFCPHAMVERDSAYLDDLKARAAKGEPLKREAWKERPNAETPGDVG